MKKIYALIVCITVWGAALFAQTEADFDTKAEGAPPPAPRSSPLPQVNWKRRSAYTPPEGSEISLDSSGESGDNEGVLWGMSELVAGGLFPVLLLG